VNQPLDSTGTVRLVIRQPDDWHVHLRDGAMLQAVVGYTARQFARAIVMPNLDPPVTTVAAALAYRQRILEALPGRRQRPRHGGRCTSGASTRHVWRVTNSVIRDLCF